MRNIKIKEVMTPINEYLKINENQTLYYVFSLLGDEKNTENTAVAHRDLIVVDESGDFKGKITMIDLFRALEPKYKFLEYLSSDGTLTKKYVKDAVKEFDDLWLEPVTDLCKRGRGVRVSEVMHIPSEHEFIDENDSAEIALHQYVVGCHQPLIVKNGSKVTGILRFEDLFTLIKTHMLMCKMEA